MRVEVARENDMVVINIMNRKRGVTMEPSKHLFAELNFMVTKDVKKWLY